MELSDLKKGLRNIPDEEFDKLIKETRGERRNSSRNLGKRKIVKKEDNSVDLANLSLDELNKLLNKIQGDDNES